MLPSWDDEDDDDDDGREMLWFWMRTLHLVLSGTFFRGVFLSASVPPRVHDLQGGLI